MPISVKRGEIYWLDWEQGKGSEQAGIRPALIIQNDIGNAMSPNTIVAAITSAPNRPYRFMVTFTPEESGLHRGGAVDLASLVTVSKMRLGAKCGQLTPAKMAEVNRAIEVSLGLR